MKHLRNYFLLFALTLCAVNITGQTIRLSEPVIKISANGSFFSFARVSPDGEKIAVSFPDYRGIALLTPAGTVGKVLTEGAAAGWNFVWSPDSRKIATRINYWNDRAKRSSIAVFSVNGSEKSETTPAAWVSLPFWSWNAGSVSYFEENDEWKEINISKSGETAAVIKDSSLFLINSNNGAYPEFQPLTFPGMILNSAWSPDRSKVAVEVLGMGLFTYDFTTGTRYDLGMGEFPNWLDNEYIVYMFARSNNSSFAFSDLIAQRFDGRNYTNLTETNNEVVLYPSVAKDGTTVFVTNKGELYRTKISVEKN